MKPTKIVLFIILILGGLLSLAFFFPKEGIRVTDDWVLHFPTIDEFLGDSEAKVVDITEIIEKNQVADDSVDVEGENDDLVSAMMDDSTIIYYEPVPINPEEVTRKLEFPVNNTEVLDPFFKELAQVKSNGKLIRVLHYGDSQIEADRISSYLRYKLQGQFGGSGPGLIPPVQPYGFKAPVVAEYSEGWKRFPGFGKRDTSIEHTRYGVLASFGKFVQENVKADSSKASNPELQKEWLQFEHSPYSRTNVKKYTQCRIFYGYNKSPVKLKLLAGENKLDEKVLEPSNSLQIKKWNFDTTPEKLRFVFEGQESPEIYALALDGKKGVAVDNIPLRGSTGTVFTNSDTEMLSSIYQNLNAKLLIMQFGGNAAPSMNENYAYYERSFYNQLAKLKRLIPGVSIIVIGIADMSKKDKDQYVSLPNVTLIRDALKKAAFKAECAFWDTYEAMGGENSMPSWVFNDPPLAEKDFTHFTVQGSQIVAQMFYKALMLEYRNYFNSKIKGDKSVAGNVQLSSK